MTWECSIEHGLEEIKILKFILQPLAENSIYHGFRDSGECGHIEIRVYTSGKNLQLCVSDNGIGMMPEQLEILKSRMAWKQMTEQSIQEGGIWAAECTAEIAACVWYESRTSHRK